jgi:hypothetical protein
MDGLVDGRWFESIPRVFVRGCYSWGFHVVVLAQFWTIQTVQSDPVSSICQAGTAAVAFALDMNSSAYHIVVGAVNPRLLSMN